MNFTLYFFRPLLEVRGVLTQQDPEDYINNSDPNPKFNKYFVLYTLNFIRNFIQNHHTSSDLIITLYNLISEFI